MKGFEGAPSEPERELTAAEIAQRTIDEEKRNGTPNSTRARLAQESLDRYREKAMAELANLDEGDIEQAFGDLDQAA